MIQTFLSRKDRVYTGQWWRNFGSSVQRSTRQQWSTTIKLTTTDKVLVWYLPLYPPDKGWDCMSPTVNDTNISIKVHNYPDKISDHLSWYILFACQDAAEGHNSDNTKTDVYSGWNIYLTVDKQEFLKVTLTDCIHWRYLLDNKTYVWCTVQD